MGKKISKFILVLISFSVFSCSHYYYKKYNEPEVKERKHYAYTVLKNLDTLYFSDKAISLGLDLRVHGFKTVVINNSTKIQCQVGGKLRFFKSFYENGRLKEFGQYSRNKKNGAWLYFNKDGTYAKFEYWEKGTIKDSIK